MSRTTRVRAAVAAVACIAVMGTAGCSDDATTTAKDTTTRPSTTAADTTSTVVVPPGPPTIRVGGNDPADANIAILEFQPEKVSVAVGQPLRWDWTGTIEPHSVTFVPPGAPPPDFEKEQGLALPTPAAGPIDGSALVNSGLLPLGPDPVAPLDLTFSKAGSYTYYCVIHPDMTGTVTVTDGTGDTAAEVAERAATEHRRWLAEGQAAKKRLVDAKPAAKKAADGSTTYTVEMGTTTEHTDVLAFAPTPRTVKVGDQVTFLNRSRAPHTATFFGTGAEPITSPIDPRVDPPAPGPSPQPLSSAGFINSGLLPPDSPPGSGPPEAARSFTFTVPTAGSYSYVCLLHESDQMVGSITAT